MPIKEQVNFPVAHCRLAHQVLKPLRGTIHPLGYDQRPLRLAPRPTSLVGVTAPAQSPVHWAEDEQREGEARISQLSPTHQSFGEAMASALDRYWLHTACQPRKPSLKL